MKKRLLLVSIVAVGAWLSGTAHAFPEMVREGYPNCITCHVSPNGGGVLTDYGRQISADLLSTWAAKGESDFLYGAVKPPSWLNVGGDVRVLQDYMDTPQLTMEQFFLMQADAEAAVNVGKFTADATLGKNYLSGPGPYSFLDNFLSRRHYVMYHANDQIEIRAGRFNQAFGINTPDHAIVTKQGLNWDEGTETYNVEAAWIGDNADVFLTANFGRFSDQTFEKGFAARGSYTLSDTYKAGLSYYFGTSPLTGSRHVFGPFFILGFTHHFFLLSETDLQRAYPAGGVAPSWGEVTYNRLDYEWIQGLHTYVTAEFNYAGPVLPQQSFGLGVQWFPRPHLEANLAWQKQKYPDLPFQDFAYIMLHYYL